MIYTSAQASKLLSKLQAEFECVRTHELNTYIFTVSLDENVEDARPEYSYTETKEKIAELEEKIRKTKHALNVFNSTTVVPEFGMTIDEMLVYIPQLSAKKAKLTKMANRVPKERLATGPHRNLIEYVYINYKMDDITADLEKVTDELGNAQLALDLANHTYTLELDF